MTTLADDWRDVPPPVVSHKHDAYARGLMPWDTAPRPVAPQRAPGHLTTYAAAKLLGVGPGALWKRTVSRGVDVSRGLPLATWQELAAGLARGAR